LVASFKRFGSKRCSVITLSRWQIMSFSITASEVWDCDLMVANWLVLQLLNFLMNQNSSVSIFNIKRKTSAQQFIYTSIILFYICDMFRSSPRTILRPFCTRAK
jgi:endogenous inhibitor of DNA gyrase (YacG/DUF329 family)